jgi:hypothetical protein
MLVLDDAGLETKELGNFDLRFTVCDLIQRHGAPVERLFSISKDSKLAGVDVVSRARLFEE